MYKYVNKESIGKTIGSIVIPALGGYTSKIAVEALDALSDGYGIDRYVDSVLSNPFNDKVNSNTSIVNTEINYYADAQRGSDTSSGYNVASAVNSITKALNLAITTNTTDNKLITVYLADGDYSNDPAFYGRLSGQNIKIVGNTNSPESVLLPQINIFGAGNIEIVGVRAAGISIQDTTATINSCYIDNEYVKDKKYGCNNLGYTQIVGTSSGIDTGTLQPDGKIVLSGYTIIAGVYQVLSIRLNTNGTLDTTYAIAGTYTQIVGTDSNIITSVIQPDGKLVLSGYGTIAGVSQVLSIRLNSTGTLDTTYATAGTYTQIVGTDSSVNTTVIQPDGKIVLSGYAEIAGVYQVLSIRLNSNGTLDTTYATAGTHTQIVGTNSGIYASALQPDSKIVLSGFAQIAGISQVLSIRLNSNGTLDTTYATAGTYTQIVGTKSYINTSAIQPDGKIVLSGYAQIAGVYQVLSIRLNSNGTLDTTYATAGTYTQIVGTQSIINTTVLQPDGKIVLSGYVIIAGVYQVLSIRLNSNGTLDTTYATAGTYTQIVGTDSNVSASIIQPDGKIVLSGHAVIAGVWQVLSIRLNSNGTLDSRYALTGDYTQVVGSTDSNIITSVLQPDSKLVLSGYAQIAGVYQVLSIRLNSNGTLDTTYATAGTYTQIVDTNSSINTSVLQLDGKIVLSGYAVIAGVPQVLSIRLNSNGTLDTTYATAGTYTQIVGTDSCINTSAIQPDSKLVLSGYAQIAGVYQVLSIRLNSNGTLDTTYATAGTYTQIVGTNSSIYTSGLQPDGKVVISGSTQIAGVYQVLSIRLNSNGTLDTTYATAGTYTQIVGTNSCINTSAIQLDGKVVISGSAVIAGVYQVLSIRLNSNGTLDTTYATAGTYTQIVGTDSSIRVMLLQPDGKVVLSGYAVIAGVGQVLSIRLNPTMNTMCALNGTLNLSGTKFAGIGNSCIDLTDSTCNIYSGTSIVADPQLQKGVIVAKDSNIDMYANITGTVVAPMYNISHFSVLNTNGFTIPNDATASTASTGSIEDIA